MRPLLALVVLLLSALPVAAAGVLRAPDPAWVDVAPLPEADGATRAAATGGTLYLLVDDQIAWQGETRMHYARRAIEVTDRAGLESAATIDWDFAPDFDTVTLTRILLHRAGETIDLTDRITPEILRRETRLEAGILDGSLTAHYDVPGLRVGDVLDYSFVMADRPALPGSTFGGSLGLEFGSPVALTRVALNWPDGRTLHLGPLPDRIRHSSRRAGAATRHEWRREGHVPFVVEDLTPVEDYPDAALRYSDQADWGALVTALLPHYAGAGDLPADWDARIDAIRRDNPDDLTRATAALRLVQDQIRYVGIEIGLGGIIPRPPATVIDQGFGDCKDKSLLLQTLLRRLGIRAEVALTDLDFGRALPLELPWLGAFDHMIVAAHIGGQTYWMDPTASHQGGRLDRAAVPDYGYALPLRPGATALEPINVPEDRSWITDTTETYSFGLWGMALKVVSTFEGAAADSQRFRFATDSADAISRDLLSYYADRYPGIRMVGKVEMRDDMVENRVVTTESYLLSPADLDAGGLRHDLSFAAEDFGGYYPSALISPRERPLTIGQPKRHHHRIRIDGAPISFDPPAPVTIRNPAFDFRLDAQARKPGALQIDWDFRTGRRVVAAADVAGVVRDARRVSLLSSMTWDIDPGRD